MLISAPTSAGKSLVAELLLILTLSRHLKAYDQNLHVGQAPPAPPLGLLVVPLVSLVQEKAKSLAQRFQHVKIGRPQEDNQRLHFQTGSLSKGSGAKGLNRLHLAVCTYEKAFLVVQKLIETGELHRLKCVVIDEVHMIGGGGSRGMQLELLMSMLIYLRQFNSTALRLIAMSATISNLSEIATWMQAIPYKTDYRPLQCALYLKYGTGRGFNGKIHPWLEEKNKGKSGVPGMRGLYSRLSPFQVSRTLDADGKDRKQNLQRHYTKRVAVGSDGIPALVWETVSTGGKVLVFCATKNGCERMAKLIGRELTQQRQERDELEETEGGSGGGGSGGGGSGGGEESGGEEREEEEIAMLIRRGGCLEVDKVRTLMKLRKAGVFPLKHPLVTAVAAGVAYHSTNVSMSVRNVIETDFREKFGLIKVIVCTSTLAQGVNFPVR